jgi:hypothetical protein
VGRPHFGIGWLRTPPFIGPPNLRLFPKLQTGVGDFADFVMHPTQYIDFRLSTGEAAQVFKSISLNTEDPGDSSERCSRSFVFQKGVLLKLTLMIRLVLFSSVPHVLRKMGQKGNFSTIEANMRGKHRAGRPIHDRKCRGCVKDRQSVVLILKVVDGLVHFYNLFP